MVPVAEELSSVSGALARRVCRGYFLLMGVYDGCKVDRTILYGLLQHGSYSSNQLVSGALSPSRVQKGHDPTQEDWLGQ